MFSAYAIRKARSVAVSQKEQKDRETEEIPGHGSFWLISPRRAGAGFRSRVLKSTELQRATKRLVRSFVRSFVPSFHRSRTYIQAECNELKTPESKAVLPRCADKMTVELIPRGPRDAARVHRRNNDNWLSTRRKQGTSRYIHHGGARPLHTEPQRKHFQTRKYSPVRRYPPTANLTRVRNEPWNIRAVPLTIDQRNAFLSVDHAKGRQRTTPPRISKAVRSYKEELRTEKL